jgi:hypothetical protein
LCALLLPLPPFGKGGYGGFALALASGQEQIPLDPPFSKGEANAHRVQSDAAGCCNARENHTIIYPN